ncbi:hypothetical protein D3C87_1203300 [compost metagenome]
MKILLLLLPIGLMGCASMGIPFVTQSSPTYYEDTTEKNNAILAAKRTETSQECNGICSYVSTKTYGEMKEHYADCKKRKISTKACDGTFFEMLNARLMLQYPNANIDKVVLWCKSEPRICNLSSVEGANALEGKIIESQNEYADRKMYEHQAEVARRNEEMNRARSQAISAYFAEQYRQQQIQNNIQQLKQTNCTSTRVGNQVRTDCH